MYDPIMVVGAGRSGTSAIAGILHHAGVFMGYHFFNGKLGNPKGHWEDVEFLRMHKGIHAKLHTDKWNQLMDELIEKRLALEWPWGFKDPRTAYLFDYYFDKFSEPKIIWAKRNIDDIHRSILVNEAKRKGKEVTKADIPDEKVIKKRKGSPFVTRNNYIKELSGYKHFLTVEFEDLINNHTGREIDRILEFVGIPVSHFTLNRLVDFIKLPPDKAREKGLSYV